MKKITLFLGLLASTGLFAQNYVPDTTFGNNAMAFYDGVSFYPDSGGVVNNNYYFTSENKLGKVNYDGAIDTNFGTNGFITLTSSTETFTIEGFKFIDNYFYVYGTATNIAANTRDAFICKINETGNFDSTFATNGMAKFDFSGNETLEDFVVTDNKLFCVGTKYVTGTAEVLYFKVNNNGSVDTTFDTNGYKTFSVDNYSAGYFISAYNNNFFIAGNTNIGNGVYSLLMLEVSQDGALVTSFGTDGYKVEPLDSNASSTVNQVQLYNNALYISYRRGTSNLDTNAKILKYNLSTNQTDFNIDAYRTGTNFLVTDEGMYVTGTLNCNPFGSPELGNCNFNLDRKLITTGAADTSFFTTGSYNYDFPHQLNSNDLSSVLVKDDSGNILIGGSVYRDYFDANNNYIHGHGFGMTRITSGPLSTDDVKASKATLYPNPFENVITVQTDKQVKNIVVYDLSGRMVANKNYNNTTGVINVELSSLQKGAYLVRIETADAGVFSEKVIKQ
ncbi:T9SS type A sorting domain-containing protein [Flavobacterium subsaxonicum]|uniref:Secretion system C-terminal sorting domain-containing protein n=1 Tax=Flavobacterium subsaxonicum WB 4.1-42 = DSM 21790 TaxID=1121898 RepID=A0A0A2ML69_9FLAO|nr:T9SS type A sorting domain-containing protein [Flavobacterium subsaxonicum]KGO93059.1 hypothetical protein Q766_10620 [Flavobacterium subsaxonicum WB 4.1-42 = DSM 21790]